MCDPATRRTPVIIVTGYAASGKTTLVNLLLGDRHASAMRVGVIAHRQVEEYGIAPHPIHGREAGVEYDEVFDFGSGCLCCSPSGEMTRLLGSWAERLHQGHLHLDLLLIKAAPLASPLVFARCIAHASGRVAEAFHLASIVAVVSPRHALRHLAAGSPEWQARAQLEAADLVVLRDVDEEKDVDAVVRLVQAHSQVPLLRLPAAASAAAWARLQSEAQSEARSGVQGEVQSLVQGGVQSLLREVLSCRAAPRFSEAAAAALDPSWRADALPPPALVRLTGHDTRVVAAAAAAEEASFEPPLRAWLQGMAASGAVLRLKGVLRLRDGAGSVEGRPRACSDEERWLLVDGVEGEVWY